MKFNVIVEIYNSFINFYLNYINVSFISVHIALIFLVLFAFLFMESAYLTGSPWNAW